MKKFFLTLVLIGLLMSFALPTVYGLTTDPEPDIPETCTAHKRADDVCQGTGEVTISEDPLCCIISGIYRITDWIFFFLIALVVLFVLFGAFSLLTAAGDPTKIEKGRNFILWAAIGFIVALVAWFVPEIAKLVIGFK